MYIYYILTCMICDRSAVYMTTRNIRIYTYTYIHTYIFIHIYTYIYIHIYIYICVCVCAYMYIPICILNYIYILTCVICERSALYITTSNIRLGRRPSIPIRFSIAAESGSSTASALTLIQSIENEACWRPSLRAC